MNNNRHLLTLCASVAQAQIAQSVLDPSAGGSPNNAARPRPGHLFATLLALLAMLMFWVASPARAADQAPTRTISGAATGLSIPYGLAKLADGSLAVANRTDNSVKVYVSDATGDEAPTRTISGVNTGLSQPGAVVVLTDGSLAVANYSNFSVTVYASGATGDEAPTHTISGVNTGLSGPVGLAVLADGSLAVSNYDNHSVTVYASGASGNVAPTRTISGVNTGLTGPIGVAVLAGGSLAVSNANNNSVTVYASDANGNVAPTRTISGVNTGLSQPHWVQFSHGVCGERLGRCGPHAHDHRREHRLERPCWIGSARRRLAGGGQLHRQFSDGVCGPPLYRHL